MVKGFLIGSTPQCQSSPFVHWRRYLKLLPPALLLSAMAIIGLPALLRFTRELDFGLHRLSTVPAKQSTALNVTQDPHDNLDKYR